MLKDKPISDKNIYTIGKVIFGNKYYVKFGLPLLGKIVIIISLSGFALLYNDVIGLVYFMLFNRYCIQNDMISKNQSTASFNLFWLVII